MKSSKILGKKIIICLISIISVLMMTGCGERLKTFVSNDVQSKIEEKFEANITILGQLKSAQFITDTEYNTILNSIQNQESVLQKQFDQMADNGTVSGSLVEHISKYRVFNGCLLGHAAGVNSIKDDKGTDTTIHTHTSSNCDGIYTMDNDIFKLGILTNFLVYSQSSLAAPSNDNPHICEFDNTTLAATVQSVDDKNITPLVIVNETWQQSVEEKFDYNIYVLKPNLENAGDFSSVDNLITAINNCLSETEISTGVSGFTVTNTALLDNYFTKAVDSNGNAISLIADSNGNIPDEYKLVTDSEPVDLDADSSISTTPGKDLVIEQYGLPEFSIRFTEFNQEHWNNLREVMGLNDAQYIFCESNGEKRAYLMEYPVYYLNSIDYDESTDTVTGYINGYNKSSNSSQFCSLGLNLATGKIIKYKWDGSNWSKIGYTTLNDDVQSYLTTTSDQTNGETGLSSFIVKGAQIMKVSVNLETGTSNREVTTGRIILRDYLEGTYAPGFVSGENLVVFGRKIRLNFNNWTETEFIGNKNYKQYTPTWSRDETMAVYVDATGNQIETAPTLKATDFGDTYAIRYKDSWSKNKLITITTLGIADNTLTLGTAEDGVIHDVDDLPHLYANKGASGTGILVQTQFPYVSSTSTLAVGADDWNNDSSQKQRFFVLFVAKNMFDSTLFSQWINNDSSSNSLNWWNDYLASYSYTYTVSHEAVNSYLTTNFTYELNQNGVVVLDLDTINKVAQIYKTEADDQRVSNIRTFFMIFGWFLIGYSMILMLAWVLDANTDVGIKLLEKLTLGNWVAVKYEDDIPYRNTNDRTYLTGGKMAIKCMIIVTIGVLLIRINIFRIVLKLINLFGGFASQVQSIILGLRG